MFSTLNPTIFKNPRATLISGEPRGPQRFECYAMQDVIAALELSPVTLCNEGGPNLQPRSRAVLSIKGNFM